MALTVAQAAVIASAEHIEYSIQLITKEPITSKIKHAIKLKTSPARLAQLLQLPH